MTDLAVTWPKDRRLASYIAGCHNAKSDGLVINFRVRNPPDRRRLFEEGEQPPRLYRVHDGFVRGYTPITAVTFKEDVLRVADDPLPGNWPPGWYIVCDPTWTDAQKPLVAMKGFRGYRWFARPMRDGG